MSSVRSRIAGEAEAKSEQLIAALFEAVESNKSAWAYCPNCKKKVQVDHADHGARLKAVEMLLEQGYGRPGTGSANAAPEIVGGKVTIEQMEAMSTNDLAAYAWASQSEEEREADRRLIEAVGKARLPVGFAEALEELDGLAREHAGAVV